jgi:hypothetical protein
MSGHKSWNGVLHAFSLPAQASRISALSNPRHPRTTSTNCFTHLSAISGLSNPQLAGFHFSQTRGIKLQHELVDAAPSNKKKLVQYVVLLV